MFRSISAVLTMAAAAGLVPAHAQSAPASQATLAAPPAAGTMIVREQTWRCEGASCTAGASNSRPLIACMALARKAGRVERFTTAGTALGEAELARCNAVAATGASTQQ